MPFGLGFPIGLAVVCVAFDAWRRRRVDWVLAAGALLLIVSFPARIALVNTPAWGRAAAWLASLVA